MTILALVQSRFGQITTVVILVGLAVLFGLAFPRVFSGGKHREGEHDSPAESELSERFFVRTGVCALLFFCLGLTLAISRASSLASGIGLIAAIVAVGVGAATFAYYWRGRNERN
jgi:hypothetical protein